MILISFESLQSMDPCLWAEHVKEEANLQKTSQNDLSKFFSFGSNIRKWTMEDASKEVFASTLQNEPDYNAYQHDIAMINFYFESPTCFEYQRYPSMTLIDFMAQVGGFLGACIGFSFISGIEIVYWFTIRLLKNPNSK